ncbi:HNH endonuclease signature motif containing protein [Kocuria aegyptia]|uniref:HNH nuclease domain-containing protein n=1 Tax=Kocuria aegyptia TaxID=330943 RepID=A0ABN2KJX3_9MICC
MTATAQWWTGTPVAGEGLAAGPVLPETAVPGAQGESVRAAAAGLVDAAAAEARAVGAQMRCIHRLWLAAQAARTAARFEAMAQAEAEMAASGFVRPDPLSPLAEAEHQLVVDVAAEVGPALRLPPGTARRRVEDAVLLAEMLPEVLAALEDGRIGAAQATVMVEQWRELVEHAPSWTSWQCVPPPVEAVCRLITEFLERAPHATAAQLRATARARRAVLVADTEERSRRTARKNHAVWVEPAADGMAHLHALLDAHVAVAVHSRLEDLGALLGEDVPVPGRPGLLRVPHSEGPEGAGNAEPRSAGELRADVLADLLLDGVLPDEPGFPRGVRARVSVMVPVTLLTGGGAGVDACGVPTLSGFGPISSEVARQLAAGAGVWHRVLTHPVTGVVLDHDRTVYAVPRDLRRLVELRDGTCRFPGCRRRAERCDLDHTVAWADGGPTAERNLAALCRQHHRIKHRDGHLGRWSVRRIVADPDDATIGSLSEPVAVLEWTSPGGLVHRPVPEHAGGRCTVVDRRGTPISARRSGGPPPREFGRRLPARRSPALLRSEKPRSVLPEHQVPRPHGCAVAAAGVGRAARAGRATWTSPAHRIPSTVRVLPGLFPDEHRKRMPAPPVRRRCREQLGDRPGWTPPSATGSRRGARSVVPRRPARAVIPFRGIDPRIRARKDGAPRMSQEHAGGAHHGNRPGRSLPHP